MTAGSPPPSPESTVAAERGNELIAVEIKSFVSESDISSFLMALGQYLNYAQALEEQEPDRIIFLALPAATYEDFIQLPFIQRALQRYQVRLLVYEPEPEEVQKWIS